jgi:hypothetical protein
MTNIIDLDAHRPPPIRGNGALEIVRDYLERVHPARTVARSLVSKDESDAALPDADYFLAYLANEGFLIVPVEQTDAE